jgi:MSHA biogenesis protein MshQ
VDVDLVDASATACPSGAGLGTATTLAFVSGNAGRKNLNLTYSGAAPNIRIRMKQGASAPSCSTDKFAIRPSGAQIVTTANAVAPSATASPKFKAGTDFALSATTNPSSYAGNWTFDSSKLSAQTTT